MDTSNKQFTPPEQVEIIRLLQAQGITPTAQRVKIASILLARPQHLSADQVLAQTNREGQHVSKATVYNTLGLFAEKGLVQQVIVDPTKVFYDSNTHQHHHFYDVDTGELTDIGPGRITVGDFPELPAGKAVDGVDVIVKVRSKA